MKYHLSFDTLLWNRSPLQECFVFSQCRLHCCLYIRKKNVANRSAMSYSESSRTNKFRILTGLIDIIFVRRKQNHKYNIHIVQILKGKLGNTPKTFLNFLTTVHVEIEWSMVSALRIGWPVVVWDMKEICFCLNRCYIDSYNFSHVDKLCNRYSILWESLHIMGSIPSRIY